MDRNCQVPAAVQPALGSPTIEGGRGPARFASTCAFVDPALLGSRPGLGRKNTSERGTREGNDRKLKVFTYIGGFGAPHGQRGGPRCESPKERPSPNFESPIRRVCFVCREGVGGSEIVDGRPRSGQTLPEEALESSPAGARPDVRLRGPIIMRFRDHFEYRAAALLPPLGRVPGPPEPAQNHRLF